MLPFAYKYFIYTVLFFVQVSYKPIKKNWCKFCKTKQSKLMRHMTLKHSKEPEVEAYLNIKAKDGKELKKLRKEAAHFMISSSNENYNKEFIDAGEEQEVIVYKKGTSVMSVDTHIKCTACGALITKKNFSRHKFSCKKRQNLLFGTQKDPICTFILPPVPEEFKVFATQVLNTMQKDEISQIVYKQNLILAYGKRFFMGHRAKTQVSYVASKVRSLASLFLKMREIDPSLQKFEECLKPKNFENLLTAVRTWSSYSEVEGRCGVASVPRRLCKSLKVCSELMWSMSLKDKNLSKTEKETAKTEHKEFIHLMNSDWAHELGCIGDLSLKKNKMTKKDKMPEKDDIVIYFDELKKIINKTMEKFESSKGRTYETFSALVKAVLAFLVAFNGRRPGEVSGATIEDYKTLQTNEGDKLSVFMVVATKNDTRVPIITPEIVKTAINKALQFRNHFQIPGILLFPKKDGTAYNGSHLINEFKSKITLKNPKDLTANGFRHYWATETQKNPLIKQHMPKFLGHSDSVHKKFYELPHSEIHLNLIGPYLQQTTQVNHRGESDSDLQETSNVNHTVETNCASKTTDSDCNSSQNYQDSHDNSPQVYFDIKPKKKAFNKQKTLKRKMDLRKKYAKTTYTPKMNCNESSSDKDEELDNTSEDPDFDAENLKPKIGIFKRKENVIDDDYSSSDSSNISFPECAEHFQSTKRTRWNTPEKKELYEGLPKTVLGLQTAGRGNVKKFWENTTVIKNRHSLQMTRIELSKYYTQKKKIPTPIKNVLQQKIIEENK